MIVRSYMGFGSSASRVDRFAGFRTGDRGPNRPASFEWAAYPDALAAIIDRVTGVTIENMPALQLIAARDAADVLFYVDPPYVHGTRSMKQNRGAPGTGYRHELSDDDHKQLLDVLLAVKGKVVLSGYPCAIYDRMLKGWLVVEREAMADGARKRTEVLWLNPAAVAAGEVARPVQHRTLFENANAVRGLAVPHV